MLKKFSILTLLAGVALCSCQTMEFSDVAPETKGTALGSVKLGKEGKDFFVIPGSPITPAQMRGESPIPPQNIVVFKTRERQPLYRAAHAAGAPARGLHRAYNFVIDAIVNLTFGWFKKKAPAPQPENAVPQSYVYPASLPATPAPFASARPLGGAAYGPQTAPAWSNPQTLRSGG